LRAWKFPRDSSCRVLKKRIVQLNAVAADRERFYEKWFRIGFRNYKWKCDNCNKEVMNDAEANIVFE